MSGKIPLPAEFLADDREKELVQNEEFQELVDKHKLTIKEQKYAVLMFSRPDLTHNQKAERAGYAVDENGKAKSNSISKDKIVGALGDALLEFGVSKLDLALTIKEGLTARKIIHKVVPTYNKEGKKDGAKVEAVDGGPDHAIRKYYANLLFANYAPKTMKHEHEFSPKMIESLEMVQKRERLLTGELQEAEFEEVNARPN